MLSGRRISGAGQETFDLSRGPTFDKFVQPASLFSVAHEGNEAISAGERTEEHVALNWRQRSRQTGTAESGERERERR